MLQYALCVCMLQQLPSALLDPGMSHVAAKRRKIREKGVGAAPLWGKARFALRTLHTAHCTLHTAHCTPQTAHCTLYTAHRTLHTQAAWAPVSVSLSSPVVPTVCRPEDSCSELHVDKWHTPAARGGRTQHSQAVFWCARLVVILHQQRAPQMGPSRPSHSAVVRGTWGHPQWGARSHTVLVIPATLHATLREEDTDERLCSVLPCMPFPSHHSYLWVHSLMPLPLSAIVLGMHPLCCAARSSPLQAFQNVLKRMLEAAGRGMWQASPQVVRQLREQFADMDNELEGVTLRK